MPKESFKIVFVEGGWIPSAPIIEQVTFECSLPRAAVEQYAAMVVQKNSYLSAKVYPADTPAIVEISGKVSSEWFGNAGEAAGAKAKGCRCGRCKPAAKPVESKLFNGYTEVPRRPKVPIDDKFFTENSGWIEAVTWGNYAGGSICIHFRNGGRIVYNASYDDFEAFRLWSDNGGSAGRYYNANVKGIMEVIDL
jgi:hypothetical protein